jgi:hypothetical protein
MGLGGRVDRVAGSRYRPLAKPFLMPKCANVPFASLPCTLGGLRVKNIHVGELPPEAAWSTMKPAWVKRRGAQHRTMGAR